MITRLESLLFVLTGALMLSNDLLAEARFLAIARSAVDRRVPARCEVAAKPSLPGPRQPTAAMVDHTVSPAKTLGTRPGLSPPSLPKARVCPPIARPDRAALCSPSERGRTRGAHGSVT